MCAFLRYATASLAILLTSAYIAASNESGLSAFRPMVFEPVSAGQTVVKVNRTNKGDREIRNAATPTTTAQTKPVTAKEQKILEGCDPAFSPLTASAKNNFSNRCLA